MEIGARPYRNAIAPKNEHLGAVVYVQDVALKGDGGRGTTTQAYSRGTVKKSGLVHHLTAVIRDERKNAPTRGAEDGELPKCSDFSPCFSDSLDI